MAAIATAVYTPEFASATRDLTLERLGREIRTTSRVIAAIPDSGHEFKPDPKSRSAWDLAWHIAFRDVWFLDRIADLSLDLERTRPNIKPPSFSEISRWYETAMSEALPPVGRMTGEQLPTPLTFFGHVQPAFQFLIFMCNHSIHHRGQLSTYVRAAGGKLPRIYGSSADTPM
jgi:uncharacterized damage-inducible protein DinB